MIMSISYETKGRTAQKARTRAALIAAARRLLSVGITPSVEQAAGQASISRPTAYRYFPNQRALLAATNPEITMPSLLGPNAPAELSERLDLVAKVLTSMVLEQEAALRAMLRISLERPCDGKELALRTGRRIVWIEDALAPLRGKIPKQKFRKVVFGVAAALGIESLVWLVDVAGLSRKEAVKQMRWSAREIAGSALTEWLAGKN